MIKSQVALSLLIFVFLAQGAAGFDVSCRDDGSIIVSEIEKKGTVYAKPSYSSNFFEVDGRWIVHENSLSYVSEEAVLVDPEPSNNMLMLNAKRVGFTCPGFVYSEKMINTSIISCYNKEDVFLARFVVYNYQITDDRAYRMNNPFHLDYEITADNGITYINGPYVKSKIFNEYNLSFKKYKNANLYTLSYTTNDSIYKFAIRKDGYHDSLLCNKQKICLFDEDCSENQACKDNYCQSLMCDDCEYAKEHRCISHECCRADDCKEDEYCKKNACQILSCARGYEPKDHECKRTLSAKTEKHDGQSDEIDENRSEKQGDGPIARSGAEPGYNISAANMPTATSKDQKKAEDCGLFMKNYEGSCISYIKYFFIRVFG